LHDSQTQTSVLNDEQQGRSISAAAPRSILFVTKAYEYGGAEKHLLTLLNRLKGTGLRISILCLAQDLYTERLDSGSTIQVITADCEPSSLLDWVRLFRRAQPDVVVFVYGWSWAFPWIAPIGARLAGIPRRFSIQQLITPLGTNRGWAHTMLRRLFGTLNLKVSASCFHNSIAVSDEMRNSLIRDFGFPAGRVKTIHNGASVSEYSPSERNGAEFRKKRGLQSDEFVLVCVARLAEQKGIEILLQGIAQASSKGVRCKCFIVGDGPLKKQLVTQSQELGLSGQVFFEGFRDDIRPYLQAGSAFILTSYREGLPLSIAEAMACGLPCVVTDVGGNAEAVTDNVNGLVIPAGSINAVENAISFLATHPVERAQMSQMARTVACEKFNIENCMTGIARVILN
jgi:glycosyltransferase involved in cell wall biosynthesis